MTLTLAGSSTHSLKETRTRRAPAAGAPTRAPTSERVAIAVKDNAVTSGALTASFVDNGR
jgi:hypothetical protein